MTWKRPLIITFALSCALLVVFLSFQASMAPVKVSEPGFQAANTRHTNLVATKHHSGKHVKLRPKSPKADGEDKVISTTKEPAISRNRRPPIPREGPEIRQVVFAKVHKAASSTMQNIFLRFALARNLSVLLPARWTLISELSGHFKRSDVIPQPQGKQFYDILCSHVLYNETQLSQYFPKSAVRVAIVREPLQQSLSALKYYVTTWPTGALKRGFQMHEEDPVNGFLRHPQDFYTGFKGPSGSHINNRMSIDLGVDLNNFEETKKNSTKIQAFLRQVERQFDVVLLSDYFDESLVLMRRILRWSIKDIICLKVNVAKSKVDAVWRKRPILNSNITRAFREWDEIDFQLYDRFAKIFSETIHNEPHFQEELKAFRTTQMDVRYFCFYDQTAKTLQVPKSVWTDTFTISRNDCKLMSFSEDLTGLVRRRQIQRYEAYSGKP